jgi:hypothetical protein
LLLGLQLGSASFFLASPQSATGESKRSAFRLFSAPLVILAGNRVECGIDNVGYLCANVLNDPVAAGGSWPSGTADGYIFSSGLQVAGIYSESAGPWAGDTVGAFFWEARGTQRSGTPRSEIYLSTDPADLDSWPEEARIPTRPPYDPSLSGSIAISDEDSWVRYWDVDPAFTSIRQHPTGIEITQRTHAWNAPHGQADMLYFVFEIRNATPDEEFQRANELAFFAGANGLPDEGWAIDEAFVGFAADPDISNAGENMGSAILPFDLFLAWHGGFEAPEFSYPPEVFHLPFFTQAPGFVANAWIPLSEEDSSFRGLTHYSGFSGASTGHPDPYGDRQLWRYLAGKYCIWTYPPDPLEPLTCPDFPCNTTPEIETGDQATTERSLCFVDQTAADYRAAASTGPFRLEPGESVTLVLAVVFAAAVETLPDGTASGIETNASANANPPGMPSFHPGFASARGCEPSGINCTRYLFADENPVKPIERGAGWVAYSGPTPSGRAGGALEGPENKLPLYDDAGRRTFELVPGSLLWKTLLAREFTASGFSARPQPPEPPRFTLVAGDGTVTVNWAPSATEMEGDPFWKFASDDGSPFFNPNYRYNDVQAYRIHRRAAGEDSFTVVAEFPVPDRPFVDYTCETVRPDEIVGARRILASGDTVAVEGYSISEICPLGTAPISRDGAVSFNNGSAAGPPGAGVTRETETLAAVPNAGGLSSSYPIGCFDCTVPWQWTDTEPPTANFVHEYAVTAVDLNSAYSGPISLESELLPQPVVPRGVAAADRKVHTVPDPYLGSSRFDPSPLLRQLQFVNLPARATIRIFSLSGHLVRQLEHEDPSGGGRLAWDMRDRENYHVASGVYFFHVVDPAGNEQVGKFTVLMGRTAQ